MKRCSNCRERKSEREFYRSGRGDQLRGDCMACNRQANRDRYHGENRTRIQRRVLDAYHRQDPNYTNS